MATMIRESETGSETVFKQTLDSPRWASDGKRIVGVDPATVVSGDVFGDIVVCAVEGALCRRVATRGADPIWASDDLRIYFDRSKSMDTREVWSVSPEGKDERPMVERAQVDPMATFYDISRKGQVVYVQFKQGDPELWMTDFH